MLIGIPRELKIEEYRVGLTPYSVRELVLHGHQVIVERDAGNAINFTDETYLAAGAKIVDTPEEAYQAEMVVKVKEPQPSEYALIREGQILFAYLHLAPDPQQAQALIKSGCIAIAYETVTDNEGGLPLLSPMSQVAGRLAIQAGAHCLEKSEGGSGILLGGVPGVYAGKVTVIGGGVVGSNAVRMAMGKKTQVTVLDKSLRRLQELDFQFGGRLNTAYSTESSIEYYVIDADLVVGAVLVPGHSAPKLVGQDVLKKMRPGSVMVDVAIDQGGCFETSKSTTHKKPTYVIDGIVHYCVTNMPGAVPRTSTLALNNATLPYVIALADKGYRQTFLDDPHFLNGLNVYCGKITHKGVAQGLQQEFNEPLALL
ncbi:alanine dehydrogenase [Coxiella endosymbiont of Ornithodoros amblus]|uniref:alanine dehydrogenase n=1 Tax=Coxiella endosymbiont of Ornithodoros amblus TaxID=1656166 RepID=UPI00244E2320|nr:alanine dehydrogenase [Coxiella endosymbiont of Ornithodoros amblus]MBW5802980.1 alanine dehydrogenase [Coxiella endosymbiont of Ornithodoros amblus]